MSKEGLAACAGCVGGPLASRQAVMQDVVPLAIHPMCDVRWGRVSAVARPPTTSLPELRNVPARPGSSAQMRMKVQGAGTRRVCSCFVTGYAHLCDADVP